MLLSVAKHVREMESALECQDIRQYIKTAVERESYGTYILLYHLALTAEKKLRDFFHSGKGKISFFDLLWKKKTIKMPHSFFTFYTNPESKNHTTNDVPLFEIVQQKFKNDKRPFLVNFFAQIADCKGVKTKEDKIIKLFVVDNFQLLKRNLRLRQRVIKNQKRIIPRQNRAKLMALSRAGRASFRDQKH